MGLSCSTLRAEYLKAMDLRQLLLESVGDLMVRENADRSNVKSWIRCLSSVGSDSLSFSPESKRIMSTLAIHILATSREVGLSTEDLTESGMDAVLEICISGLSLSDSESEMLLVALLIEHSLFITSDMLADQYPVTSVGSHHRSSSFALSSPISPQRLSIPWTALESFSSMTHQSIELSSGIFFPVQLTVAEVQTNASKNSSENSSQLSLPLIVSFKGSPCSAGGGDCKLIATLQNKLRTAQPMVPASSSMLSESEAAFFELDCVMNQVIDRMYLCPSGDSLILFCNGSFSGTVRRLCPIRSILRTCETRVTASPGQPSREIHCGLSDGSIESTTVCVCNLTDVGDMGPLSFSIVSIEKSVLKEFVSTWESTSSLSTSEVAQSWVVLATVGGLGGMFTVFILVSALCDWSERERISTTTALSNQLSGPPASTLIFRRKRNRKRILFLGVPEHPGQQRANQDLNLIEESLPSIFRSDSLWVKFKEEMKVYHRWLGVVFYYSPEFPRSMRVLSLFSSIVIMLFVQSVTYNIADPDDGSCEACKDENCCLSLRSTLNSNEFRCDWISGVPSANLTSFPDQGSCRFRDLGEDMTRMFIVAMISAVVSAPFALSFQYLIANVLSKTTISEAEKENERKRYQQLKMQRLARAVLPSDSLTPSRDLVEECGGSSEEDYRNLLHELSKYYNTLVPGSTKEKELRSKFLEPVSLAFLHPHLCPHLFSDAWGSLIDEGSRVNQANLSHLSATLFEWLWSFFAPSIPDEEAVKDLMKELTRVRRVVSREYQWLEGFGVKKVKSNGEAGSDELIMMQRKRLIYLFVKDMSRSGAVGGEMISNKANRDSQLLASSMADRVSPRLKWGSWLFVVVSNGGMLLYVYLFAMNQTQARQLAWFVSFVTWLIFEIFVSSTALVLVLHLLVPLYVLADVLRLKEKALVDLTLLREKFSQTTSDDQEPHRSEFNAARYLLPSWRVAAMLRELPESKLILQFSTPWPNRRFGAEEGKVSKEYEAAIGLSALSRIALFFLGSFLNCHPLGQDLLVQTLCNSTLGYLGVVLLRLSAVHPLLPLLVVAVLLLCLHFLVKICSAKSMKKLSDSAVNPIRTLTPQSTPQDAPSLRSAPSFIHSPRDTAKDDHDDVEVAEKVSVCEDGFKFDEGEDEASRDDSLPALSSQSSASASGSSSGSSSGQIWDRMFSLWHSDSESSINFDPQCVSGNVSSSDSVSGSSSSSSSSVDIRSDSVRSSSSSSSSSSSVSVGIRSDRGINLSSQKVSVAKVEVEGWRMVDDRSFNPRLFIEGIIKEGRGGQQIVVDPEAQLSIIK
jgi:hypothetical protein